jgi:hypothetical protein
MKQNRLSSSYRSGRYKFRFRTADGFFFCFFRRFAFRNLNLYQPHRYELLNRLFPLLTLSFFQSFLIRFI